MKLKVIIPSALTCGLLLTSCGPKKETASSGESTTPKELAMTIDKVDDVVTPDASTTLDNKVAEVPLEDLSKVTGFAQHVPADVEGYFSLLEGNDLIERVLGSEIAGLVIETAMGGGTRADLDQMLEGPEAQMVRAVIGEELFISVGDTAGDQAGALLDFSNRSSQGQAKFMVEMASMALTGQEPEMGDMGILLTMFGDPKGIIDVIEKATMPPITIGFKVSDPEMRDNLANMISGQIAMGMEAEMPFIEELALEKEGVQLSGLTVSGKELALLAADEKEGMSEFFGSEVEADRLIKAIASKNLHVATGVFGKYILVYAGGRMEDFKLAKDTESSFLAEKDAEFLKRYADKKIRMVSYVEKDSINAITSKSKILSASLLGLKDGLEESEAFGDTRDIQALLVHTSKTEDALMKMGTYEASGSVGFIEEGFKIESHGGSSLPHIDLESSHQFASLGDGSDVVLFANSASDPDFSGKLLDYINTLGESAYMLAKQVSQLTFDDNDFEEFKEGFGMFDQLAGKELANVWGALAEDFNAGTGTESALVIDLKGTFPKVPGVPSEVIEKGRIPRLALIMPVTDREKIGEAWESGNAAVTKLLANATEAGLFEVPMQEPIKSSEDGVATYFFSIPTITSDANPNVTVSDDFFIASTSPKFNGELTTAIKSGTKIDRKGSYMKVNFKTLQEFTSYWVNFVKGNPDALFEDNETQKEDFMANLPMIEKAIVAFGEIDSLTAHTRREGGETRRSVHFKTK